MPITREKKELIVQQLTDKFKTAKIAVITDYRGLSVEAITSLRKKGREKDTEYRIAKNTLFLIALKNAGINVDEDKFSQPIAIAFGFKDEVDAPKVINDFSKENDNVEILGGIINGEFVERESIMTLANLPTRDELYARLVGTLVAPIRNLQSVLQGNLRGLVSVLNQYKEKIS